MTHPFVECVERELAIRKSVYSERVRSGRMDKAVARREYDKMEAVLQFLRLCEERFSAEEEYQPKHPKILDITERMARGNSEARDLWFEWNKKDKVSGEE